MRKKKTFFLLIAKRIDAKKRICACNVIKLNQKRFIQIELNPCTIFFFYLIKVVEEQFEDFWVYAKSFNLYGFIIFALQVKSLT